MSVAIIRSFDGVNINGPLLFYLDKALFSKKMFELEIFQAGTHADGFQPILIDLT